MTTEQIRTKAQELGERGIDARTITVNFECAQGRPLSPEEAAAVIDGWRASAPVRHQRYRDKALETAQEAAARRS